MLWYSTISEKSIEKLAFIGQSIVKRQTAHKGYEMQQQSLKNGVQIWLCGMCCNHSATRALQDCLILFEIQTTVE